MIFIKVQVGGHTQVRPGSPTSTTYLVNLVTVLRLLMPWPNLQVRDGGNRDSAYN
jgi:hypothetical protein